MNEMHTANDAELKTNCKNCGAPLEDGYCTHCKTEFPPANDEERMNQLEKLIAGAFAEGYFDPSSSRDEASLVAAKVQDSILARKLTTSESSKESLKAVIFSEEAVVRAYLRTRKAELPKKCQCGRRSTLGAKFCGNCGHQF